MVASVFELPFDENQFDGIVCNRLFHHFREPQVRRKALRELNRVSRGPIVASLFCNASWDAVVFHVKDALRRKKAIDRIPISRRVFEADIDAAGMRTRRWMSIRPGLSKQWYAVMEK